MKTASVKIPTGLGKTQPAKPEFVPVSYIAAAIGMTAGYVYARLKEGKIPHLKCGDGIKSRVRITKADADNYIQSLRSGVKP